MQTDQLPEENTFATESAEHSWEQELEYRRASLGKRFANYLIDTIGMYLFVFMVSFILAIVLAMMGIDLSAQHDGIIFLIALSAFVGYYFFQEGFGGRTIGKYITGTRVVDLAGNPPSKNAVLNRTLCRLIPFLPFSLLYGSGDGWHDRVSKTRVINL